MDWVKPNMYFIIEREENTYHNGHIEQQLPASGFFTFTCPLDGQAEKGKKKELNKMNFYNSHFCCLF